MEDVVDEFGFCDKIEVGTRVSGGVYMVEFD